MTTSDRQLRIVAMLAIFQEAWRWSATAYRTEAEIEAQSTGLNNAINAVLESERQATIKEISEYYTHEY